MKSERFHKIFGTFFLTGKLPWCPGTWGTLAGLFFVFLLREYFILRIVFFLFFFFVGRLSAFKLETATGRTDPQEVVIDEVAGIFLSFIFIPLDLSILIIGFFLFRLLDIFKVPPAKILEKPGNGWGIMLDDISAGVYTNFALHLIVFLFN